MRRNARHGEFAEAGARGNLHGGTARLPEQLRERELESLTATRQATCRKAREEVVPTRIKKSAALAARRPSRKLEGQPTAESEQERH